MTVTVDQILPLAVGLGVLGVVVFLLVRAAKRSAARAKGLGGRMNERIEALFRASFPELQPHFHPARVYLFTAARRARTGSRSAFSWKDPPGFAGVAAAEVEPDGEGTRERVRLLDAAGAPLGKFVFEEHAEGGILRVGKGKFTVNIRGPQPRVRYWHPEREFKWTPTSWKMNTGMAEQALESSSSSSYDSDSHSSSRSSSAATAAAAGAGIVAAGGTFDGGGASAAWDDPGGGSSSSGSDSSPDFSSVESGSSSSSSTSY